MALLSTVFTRMSFANRLQAIRFCSGSRDIVSSRQKRNEINNPVNSQDILLGTLKTSPSTENILELVKSHGSVMNNKHLLQALRSIFAQLKNGNSNLSTSQILKHPDFERLCRGLKQKAGTIELNETIEALKVVCYMGVSSDSTIVQVLLQLIRHQINQLSLQQIIFLDFLLSQMKPSPLLEALQIALPIIFEIHLPTKLDVTNTGQLSDCLQYVTKKEVSEGCLQYLVETIMDFRGEIDPRQAMRLLWSVCEFESDFFFEPLFKKLLNFMIVHVDNFNFSDLETTLTKMVQRFSPKYTFYYSDIFCDVCANHVMDNDLGFNYSVYLLRRFSKISHQNYNLLDYAARKVHDDPTIFSNANELMVSSLVYSLALTDFRPKYWDELKQLVTSTQVFVGSNKDLLWLKLATSLCVLDIYKPEVFEMAMRGTYLHKVMRKGYQSDFENCILMNQVIQLLKPEYMNLVQNNSLIASIISRVKYPSEYPLEGALQKAFGGPTYVLTKVFSNLHHHIDHVILLRKGGFPVAFVSKDTTQQLEDIDPGAENQIVAVLGLNATHFANNNKRMKGLTALTIKTLEMKGCTVVPICLEDWTALADYEKIPYLMQTITSKTNDLQRKSDSL